MDRHGKERYARAHGLGAARICLAFHIRFAHDQLSKGAPEAFWSLVWARVYAVEDGENKNDPSLH